MSDQPSPPENLPPAAYSYEPATVPPEAATVEPAARTTKGHRTWWIVGGVAGGLALWVFGFVGGVAASEVFDGGHDFDGPGRAEMYGSEPMPLPGAQVPGGPSGEVPGMPDFDDDDSSGESDS